MQEEKFNPANFLKIEKYDRFYADTRKGRAEYWIIDVNEMAIEGKEHYAAAVRYRNGERKVVLMPLIDLNLKIQDKKMVRF